MQQFVAHDMLKREWAEDIADVGPFPIIFTMIIFMETSQW